MVNVGMRIIKWRFNHAFLEGYRINTLEVRLKKFPKYMLCTTSNVN